MPQAPRTPALPAGAPQRVTLALIVRPRGLRGEVMADLLTDFPERLQQLQRVFLVPSQEARGLRRAERELQIRRVWLHQGRAVFHFEGIDTAEGAEKLRGCEVQIPVNERVELPAGKYFVSDLIGCEVFEINATGPGSSTSSASLGLVRDVSFDTGTPLFVVDTPRGELLIPFAEDICKRIDVAARRIDVTLPEGLLDLN